MDGNSHFMLRRRLLGSALAGLCGACAMPLAAKPLPAPALLAREWVPGDDPVGWLVSEKFDGVRALWDGRQLRFRSGRPVSAPTDFLARLPLEPLDGELWLGRGRFDELSGRVRQSSPTSASWSEIHYLVFELPGAAGSFGQRARQLKRIVQRTTQGAAGSPLQAVEQFAVGSAAELQRLLDGVVAAGGEGLMLHRENASYVTGRNEVLRKLKPVADAEAVVLQHLPGQGAMTGQMGALRVRTADGQVFDIGTGFDRATRLNPPAIGQRVTYIHRGFTPQRLPRFASFLRVAPEF